jgi:hypothetical protein
MPDAYLVFAGLINKPRRGWEDFIGVGFDNIDKTLRTVFVREMRKGRYYDWYQVVDARTLKIVRKGTSG